MITRFTYGTPVETFAVVQDIPVSGHEALRRFYRKKGQPQIFSCPLGADDVIYGLGETMRGINKRGYRYISFNYDDPHHKDDMPSMYGAHNFFVVDGEEAFGLPVRLWDERRTTIDAHQILAFAGQNAKKRKKTVDGVAAALILEGYLTFRRSQA